MTTCVPGRGAPSRALTLGNELSEETDARADKARDFNGKGHPGGEPAG